MTGFATDSAAAMAAPGSHSTAPVTIRDRRALPFFQVRLHAVQAIRSETSGPRRLRAIGFYALLCQLANEQRHTGEHRIVCVTYDALSQRGQTSKRSVKLLLDALERAGVIRYERRNGPATGGVMSLLHLLVQDEPWIAVTVAMGDHLTAPRAGGHLLRDLGLIVVYLEFCAEQRHEHGGLAAQITRGDIADRSGLTADRIDDCNHALERAGLLEISRRRAANGGRHLPSVYTVREAPPGTCHAGETVRAGRRNGTGSPADWYRQGGETVPAGRRNGTGSPADGYPQGGKSASSGSIAPPSIARASGGAEEVDVENLPSPECQTESEGRGRGGENSSSPKDLCEALLATWEPALGDSPRSEFRAHQAQWLATAAALLGRHSRERLNSALAYMVTDEILGSQALTMPGFAKVADQLIARAYARRLRNGVPRASTPGADRAPDWEEARQTLQRAIQRHGRDGRRQALEELAQHSELLVRFVERVRWGSLCEQPFQYVDRRYAHLWGELVEKANEHEEASR